MTREEAIEIVKSAFSAWESEFRVPNDDWSEEHEALDMAIEALEADTVEVVRCKDCKWYGHLGCAIRIVDDSDKPNDNDFCSFGERSEE